MRPALQARAFAGQGWTSCPTNPVVQCHTGLRQENTSVYFPDEANAFVVSTSGTRICSSEFDILSNKSCHPMPHGLCKCIRERLDFVKVGEPACVVG